MTDTTVTQPARIDADPEFAAAVQTLARLNLRLSNVKAELAVTARQLETVRAPTALERVLNNLDGAPLPTSYKDVYTRRGELFREESDLERAIPAATEAVNVARMRASARHAVSLRPQFMAQLDRYIDALDSVLMACAGFDEIRDGMSALGFDPYYAAGFPSELHVDDRDDIGNRMAYLRDLREQLQDEFDPSLDGTTSVQMLTQRYEPPRAQAGDVIVVQKREARRLARIGAAKPLTSREAAEITGEKTKRTGQMARLKSLLGAGESPSGEIVA